MLRMMNAKLSRPPLTIKHVIMLRTISGRASPKCMYRAAAKVWKRRLGGTFTGAHLTFITPGDRFSLVESDADSL